MGTVANATGESIPPNRATTFSLEISSRAATTPLGGTDSSSRCSNSILRPPSTPPLALISSMARDKPRVIASPDWADPPESAATWPILMGSCADSELGIAARAASAIPAAAPATMVNLGRLEYTFFIATPNLFSSSKQKTPIVGPRRRETPDPGADLGLLAVASLRPNVWRCDWAPCLRLGQGALNPCN